MALFWFLLAVYLLTYSPRFHSSDGLAMFSTAESLARRGEFDIDQIRWMGLQQGTIGLDGHLYSRKGAGMPLLLLPLVWLGLIVPGWGAATTALLFNSIVTAATGAVLLLAVRRLGYDNRTSLIAGLTFGLASLAWPYAKTAFSDPLAGLCLIGAALALIRFRDTSGAVNALWAGIALAAAIATRYVNVVVVPLFGALLLWYLWQTTNKTTPTGEAGPLRTFFSQRQGAWRAIVAFGAPLAVTAVLIALFNVARYGDPLNTGYLSEERFSAVWWQGIAGLLISPGRGLFLYAPVLLLALPAIPTFYRRSRPEAALAGAVVLAHLLLYGKWFMWHGGYAWGPRFMIPALPFLVMSMAPVIEWTRESAWWRRAFYVLAILSGLIQLIGLSVHFELFQNRLLDTGLPLFAPVTFSDPRYSPLLGQLGFLQPTNLDFAWIQSGQVDWLLLAVLTAPCLLAGWGLVRASRTEYKGRYVNLIRLLVALSVVVAAAWLLERAHQRWPADLRQAVTMLNRRTSAADAIITGTPDQAAVFADLFKGRAYVLGLASGSASRDPDVANAIISTISTHAQVWWLPNWLPPEQSYVEQQLMRDGFRAEDRFFPLSEGSLEGRRLALYYFPPQTLTEADLGVTLGDIIVLDRAGTLPTAHPGGVVPVILYWRAEQRVSSDFHVFVHLLDAAGDRVAHSDGQPALWMRPTTTWAPTETIEDRHGLSLPTNLPPGEYTVIAGLYLPETGERLLTELGDSSVEIRAVQIAR